MLPEPALDVAAALWSCGSALTGQGGSEGLLHVAASQAQTWVPFPPAAEAAAAPPQLLMHPLHSAAPLTASRAGCCWGSPGARWVIQPGGCMPAAAAVPVAELGCLDLYASGMAGSQAFMLPAVGMLPTSAMGMVPAAAVATAHGGQALPGFVPVPEANVARVATAGSSGRKEPVGSRPSCGGEALQPAGAAPGDLLMRGHPLYKVAGEGNKQGPSMAAAVAVRLLDIPDSVPGTMAASKDPAAGASISVLQAAEQLPGGMEWEQAVPVDDLFGADDSWLRAPLASQTRAYSRPASVCTEGPASWSLQQEQRMAVPAAMARCSVNPALAASKALLGLDRQIPEGAEGAFVDVEAALEEPNCASPLSCPGGPPWFAAEFGATITTGEAAEQQQMPPPPSRRMPHRQSKAGGGVRGGGKPQSWRVEGSTRLLQVAGNNGLRPGSRVQQQLHNQQPDQQGLLPVHQLELGPGDSAFGPAHQSASWSVGAADPHISDAGAAVVEEGVAESGDAPSAWAPAVAGAAQHMLLPAGRAASKGVTEAVTSFELLWKQAAGAAAAAAVAAAQQAGQGPVKNHGTGGLEHATGRLASLQLCQVDGAVDSPMGPRSAVTAAEPAAADPYEQIQTTDEGRRPDKHHDAPRGCPETETARAHKRRRTAVAAGEGVQSSSDSDLGGITETKARACYVFSGSLPNPATSAGQDLEGRPANEPKAAGAAAVVAGLAAMPSIGSPSTMPSTGSMLVAVPGGFKLHTPPHLMKTSAYRGVSWCKRRCLWEAAISINGKRERLGFYRHEEAAAHAYDIVAAWRNRQLQRQQAQRGQQKRRRGGGQRKREQERLQQGQDEDEKGTEQPAPRRLMTQLLPLNHLGEAAAADNDMLTGSLEDVLHHVRETAKQHMREAEAEAAGASPQRQQQQPQVLESATAAGGGSFGIHAAANTAAIGSSGDAASTGLTWFGSSILYTGANAGQYAHPMHGSSMLYASGSMVSPVPDGEYLLQGMQCQLPGGATDAALGPGAVAAAAAMQAATAGASLADAAAAAGAAAAAALHPVPVHKSSRYQGVCLCGNNRRWQAQVTFKRKRWYLGMHSTEAEAAAAYDQGAICLLGDKAHTNFPIENYDVASLTSQDITAVAARLKALNRQGGRATKPAVASAAGGGRKVQEEEEDSE